MHSMDKIMEEKNRLEDEVLEFYFAVRFFVTTYEELDENYTIYTEMEEDGRFKVKLYCINPAANLEKYLNYGKSTIFFSATLLPIGYYKKLLSVEKDDYAIYAESPFDSTNRLVALGCDVSTKYTMRGESMYQKYASYIEKVVGTKKGNYLVFFPSYKFMEEVERCFREKEMEDVTCIMQDQVMNEEEREAFLQHFEEERAESLVGFCVLGGIFSEGIDLTAERLIGAIVVGTGLPMVCNEREILKNYFDENGELGFDYAYMYSGMNKVLQAAGRVIRTEKDTGVVLLLDDRFRERRYTDIFPREWKDVKICNLQDVEVQVKQFWTNKRIP